MPSLIPNFEYDIFISYRHNDNRSGWVTDFVNALQEELAATIKEPLTIYFDKNPHDGLLETHDVDDSLKDKLKCLIFIPIISRTYCDPKSFAWNQEFLPFLKMAADDSIGLKVKLPNGNIASRVLPIRIHELDANDKGMIEAELQGVLRAIDFTYKAAGINRPLLSKDDEAIKTSGQATYRDQINKTANAISDLIGGMQGRVLTNAEIPSGDSHQSVNQEPRRNKVFKIPAFSKFQISIAALTVSLLLLAVLSVLHFSENQKSPTYKTTILPPDNTEFFNPFGGNIALSPDGTMLAFVARDSSRKSLLYVRNLHDLEARPLKSTEKALAPFWSPDSRFIGFFADGKLKKIDVAGGLVSPLIETNNLGGSWNQDDVIIFGTVVYNIISKISANGGTPSRLTHLDTTTRESHHRNPVFLPDGEHFLFASRISRFGTHEDDAIFVSSLDSTFTPKMIVKARSTYLAYANGYLLYYKGGSIVAQLFDLDKLQLIGEPAPVASYVASEDGNSTGGFSVSKNGLLAYKNGVSSDDRTEFIWYNRKGDRVGSFSHASIYNGVRISPDGTRVAIKEFNHKKGAQDIWLYEINRDAWSRFTINGINFGSVWSPDGKMIAYGSYIKNSSGNTPINVRGVGGAGTEQVLMETQYNKYLTDWSRDGKFIAYYSWNGRNGDIGILPMNTAGEKATGQSIPFLETEFEETGAVFSPDGRWIAYSSNESGRNEIYIRSFPGLGGKWQVSTKSGWGARWRGDGKELFFMGPGNSMMSAEIQTRDESVIVGIERKLFQPEAGSNPNFDVTPDGQKFLISVSKENTTSMPVTLVVNWLEELKKNK